MSGGFTMNKHQDWNKYLEDLGIKEPKASADIQNAISTLQKQILELINNIPDLGHLDKKFSNILERITDLQNKIQWLQDMDPSADLRDKITSVKDAIRDLQKKVENIETGADWKEPINNLTNQIEDLQDKVQNIQDRLNKLENENIQPLVDELVNAAWDNIEKMAAEKMPEWLRTNLKDMFPDIK